MLFFCLNFMLVIAHLVVSSSAFNCLESLFIEVTLCVEWDIKCTYSILLYSSLVMLTSQQWLLNLSYDVREQCISIMLPPVVTAT